MEFAGVVEAVGRLIDAAGIAAIVTGAILAALFAVPRLLRRQAGVYEQFRRFLGLFDPLGLELLVAADIIRTVAVSPTLESVAVLAAIVLIRTFLQLVAGTGNHRQMAMAGQGRSGFRCTRGGQGGVTAGSWGTSGSRPGNCSTGGLSPGCRRPSGTGAGCRRSGTGTAVYLMPAITE